MRSARRDRLTRPEVVDLDNRYCEFLTDLDGLAYGRDALFRELADVHKAIFAGEDVNECAEVHYAGYRAGEYVADLDLACQVVNHLHSLLSGGAVRRADDNGAVVLNVDGRACRFGDAAYGFAAWPYHCSNLVNRNLDLQHSRGEQAEVLAGVADCVAHVVEDEQAGFLSLLQSRRALHRS